MIKGISPDAEIVTNEKGGQQSKTAYGFHLIDTDAILALAEVLQYGASKYAPDNWRKIPSEEHFNHMMIHYYAWLKGDNSDDHLGHMFCRAMMVYATGREGKAGMTEQKRCCENCGNTRCANSIVAYNWDACVDSNFTKHWMPKKEAQHE